MANLKAYVWERSHFPDQQNIDVPYPERKFLPSLIANKFGINNLGVRFNCRRANSGKAHVSQWQAYIELPKHHLACSLGVIYHEIAHVLNFHKYRNHRNYHGGHCGTFRDALIAVYCDAKPFIERVRQQAVDMAVSEKAEFDNQVRLQMRKAEAVKALKAERKTPEYKIEQLKKRIKRLETRAKRINTILKSAKRKLSISERYLAKRKSELVQAEQCSIINLGLAKTDAF